MSNKMPKKKRTDSLNNWSNNCNESDPDSAMDQNRHQTDDEVKQLKCFDDKQQQNAMHLNHMIVDNQLSTNDCSLNNGMEPIALITTADHPINGQTSPNLDETNLKLRRKSNRITKPIQRSLESTITSNTPNLSLKKIVKQNFLQNVSNCDSEKLIVNKSAKSDEQNPKNSGSKAGKSLRKLQMWTNEDTKCFFEAISEHGKDFPRIQSYMTQRCEKKGIPLDLIKNYDQIRHYYYRMWHKIANSLIINEVVDKNIQEIYGLINYGEIWKKFGSKFDNKLGLHLQQLVNFGHTTFKVKGKSIRVKTPICKALKKIHKINVQENTKTNNNQNLLNLPKEVCIELHPANNESWLRVHSLSQNPRVRTKLSLQRRLSALVDYLEKRWNQSRIRDSECRTLCGTSLPTTPLSSDLCLRVRPHSSGDLNNVSLSKSFFNSQMDLSLTAYLKTLYNDELKGKSKKCKTNKSKDNKDSNSDPNMKSPNNEQTNEILRDNEDNVKTHKNDLTLNKSSETESKSDEDEPIPEAERSLTLLRMLEKMKEMSEEIHATDEEDDKEEEDHIKDDEERDLPSPETTAIVSLPEPPANATLAQWLSGAEERDDNEMEEEDNDEKKTPNVIDSPQNQMSLLSAERARKGWNLLETGSTTIGELYLLFRCPKTVLLEYIWEPVVHKVDNTSADTEESVVSSSDDITNNKNRISESINNILYNSNDLLNRLLLAANVSLTNIKRPANSSSTQSHKKKRIKPTPAPVVSNQLNQLMVTTTNNSSELLSNVISNTIFNDNSIDGNNKTEKLLTQVTINSNESKPNHHFIVPTSPAPKAVNKTKGRTICGDPALIQEALRQLQTNKYTRRQRRPTPKPVFGQNKPLLPRGSPPIVVSTTTATASSQQPIYVIPSHPLHINAITAVTSCASALSQTLPVVNMTAITANSLRQTIENHGNSEAFDVVLPQKVTQISDTNNQTLISKINSSNIPVIQIDSLSSESVSTLSPTDLSSVQTLSQTLQSFSKSAPILSSKSISLFSSHESDDKMIANNENNISSIALNSNISDVLNRSNANSTISPNDNSSDKMPLISANSAISSLLEISLPEPPFSENSCSSLTNAYNIEKRPFESLTLSNINQNNEMNGKQMNRTDPTLPTAVSSSSSSSLASPPIERHKLSSLVSDHQWLNGESCDLSIGTLLNSCESPVKSVTVRDNHSLTNDVDTQMSCLVTDNSVDLMAKFADLAAEIVGSNSKST